MLDHVYIASEQDFKDGEVIIEEGKFSDWLFVIMEGSVRIYKDSPKGQVTIATLGPGEILGELGFIESGQKGRSASAVAKGPVRLGVLDKEKLSAEYKSMSPTFRAILKILVQRVRYTTEVAVKQAVKDR